MDTSGISFGLSPKAMITTPALLDGGLSTALEELGHNLNSTLWSGALLKTAPEEIRKAHQLFVDAGATIIISSSYQLSYPGALSLGWKADEIEAALINATELARFSGRQVAASVGPYGAALADGSEYRGNYGLAKDALKDFHRKRLKILIESKPDLLAIETIPEIAEAVALTELLDELECPIPAWISFSCTESARISSGETFSEAVKAISSSSHVVAVGVNCTAPHLVSDLLRSVDSPLPFVLYPNAGRSWNSEAKTWEGGNGRTFSAEMVSEWMALGATTIGGCCGVGPQQIAELRALIS